MEKTKCPNFSSSFYQPLRIIESISVFSTGKITYTNGSGGNMKYYPQKIKLEKPYTRDHRNGTSNDYQKTGSGTVFLRKQKFGIIEYTHSTPKTLLEFSSYSGKRNHPTQKPVSLMEYLIKTYTKEGETVLDFTMGVGTTGLACVNTKRKFIGIDIEKEYF